MRWMDESQLNPQWRLCHCLGFYKQMETLRWLLGGRPSSNNKHLLPVSHQMPCWYNKLGKGGDRSHWHVENTGPKEGTEVLIMAEQKQALITRSIEARFYHTRQAPTCRLRKDNAAHNCRVEDARTHAYKEGHIQVAAIMHRNICTKFRLETRRPKLVNNVLV